MYMNIFWALWKNVWKLWSSSENLWFFLRQENNTHFEQELDHLKHMLKAPSPTPKCMPLGAKLPWFGCGYQSPSSRLCSVIAPASLARRGVTHSSQAVRGAAMKINVLMSIPKCGTCVPPFFSVEVACRTLPWPPAERLKNTQKLWNQGAPDAGAPISGSMRLGHSRASIFGHYITHLLFEIIFLYTT